MAIALWAWNGYTVYSVRGKEESAWNMRRKAGWRLEMISEALGHKHLETTLKYLNIVDDELLEASDAYYAKHSALYNVEQLL